MLKLQSGEAEWLGLIPSGDTEDERPFLMSGVRVRFLPIGRKAVRAVREVVATALGIDDTDYVSASDALSEELIRRGIVEWEGVGNKHGDPIPVTPETIELFIADPFAFEAASEAYVRPWTTRDREGNAFAGSPHGTSVQATPALDTATSRAKPRKARAAAPTRKRAVTKTAPIASTSL